MKELIFDANPRLLREYLREQYPLLSAGGFSRALKNKAILVNGERPAYHTRLQKGDRIRLYLPAHILGEGERTAALPFLAAREELAVIYEDENLLVVNKPAGLLSMGDTPDTLEHRCQLYLYSTGFYNTQAPPRLCHRLDRGTSGLVLVAKNTPSFDAALAQMNMGHIVKKYVCITTAAPEKPSATLHAHLSKNAKNATVKVHSTPHGNSRPIETGYEVLGQKNGLCLLQVKLVTGRTHQIRAHMAYIGCPILGDGKYGNEKRNRMHHAKYQALCAQQLVFNLPAEYTGPLAPLAGQTLYAPTPWFVTAFEAGTL
ncbi:RluA family pseudouridine synthase [Ruminococcaceae bacterium OttesenSCG-928-N02]|nr:RluA family pseudouridine synthase [Ruminococcaceae bacterium OttesenSCG-928-N02]